MKSFKTVVKTPIQIGENLYQFHFGALQAFEYQKETNVSPRFVVTGGYQQPDSEMMILKVLYYGIKDSDPELTFETFLSLIDLSEFDNIFLFLAQHVGGEKFFRAVSKVFDKQNEVIDKAIETLEKPEDVDRTELEKDPLSEG